MEKLNSVCLRCVSVVCALMITVAASSATADEIWIQPTYQQDLGGLGVGSNGFWPVTPIAAVRFAFPVPADLKTLQSAKVVLIPAASSGSATMSVFVCSAQDGTMAGAVCVGPSTQSFTSVANQLKEVEISTSLAGSLGTPSARPYLAVLVFTAPTTTTDHVVGLRFSYGQSVLTLETSSNTGLGVDSFRQGSSGVNNTALGSSTIFFGVSGVNNTAVGNNAMFGNGGPISGSNNTAVGQRALSQLSTGSDNTAVGVSALQELHANSGSTALGSGAMFHGGAQSTGVGAQALGPYNDVFNTAVGYASMAAGNGQGGQNTAVGALSLGGPNMSAHDNVAIGYRAGFGVGHGNFDVYVANEGQEEWNTIRLGTPFNAADQSGQSRTFIAGIRGATTGLNNGVPVIIDSSGQLGTISSSIRFKEDVQVMADASRRLFNLHPVTFRYKRAYADGSKPVQYGLVAEEVAEAFPELAVRGADGTVETVHYETLSVLLLNEMQRQEKRALEQNERIETLERQMRDWLARR